MEAFDPFAETVVFTFEGTRFKGAKVEMRLDVPMSDLLRVVAMETVPERVDWMVEHGLLVGWNLVDRKGAPLAPTGDNLKALSLPMLRTLVTEWVRVAMSDTPGEPEAGSEPVAEAVPTTGPQRGRRSARGAG